MNQTSENYLIKKLEDGNNLDIIVLANNEYWPEIQEVTNHFKNLSISFFEDFTSYIKTKETQTHNQMGNNDLIIFYSSDGYNEQKLLELKDIAFRISNYKNKRVSIGYLYYIPVEQRPCESISKQIEIASFKNGEEIIEKTYPTPYFTALDLAELTLATIDNYDIDRQPSLQKKL